MGFKPAEKSDIVEMRHHILTTIKEVSQEQEAKKAG